MGINERVSNWEIERRNRFLQETKGSTVIGNAVFSSPVFNERDRTFIWKGTLNWWKWHPYFRGLRIGPIPAMLFIGLVLGLLFFLEASSVIPDKDGMPYSYYSPVFLFWSAVSVGLPSFYYIYRVFFSETEISVINSILTVGRKKFDIRNSELNFKVWGAGKTHEMPYARNYPGSVSLIFQREGKEIFTLYIGIDPYNRTICLEQIESAAKQIASAAGIQFIQAV
ncbi:MAG TPA: hypothetical protein PL048_22905 [Leptospiraceae bacterium]|nr:hypothetical protein [Leptospiraceae bacterium]HMY65775.1 hypothetical protein [Leptospiraceae bacterium]HMZ61641.1 hypothetical protein [Leptospiraceae bacterium]HNF14166.1 hypothetical protein [Leptospiraceae bacterium]HNF22941.1 hypothetical protein [Leptospiraceae bacterium]